MAGTQKTDNGTKTRTRRKGPNHDLPEKGLPEGLAPASTEVRKEVLVVRKDECAEPVFQGSEDLEHLAGFTSSEMLAQIAGDLNNVANISKEARELEPSLHAIQKQLQVLATLFDAKSSDSLERDPEDKLTTLVHDALNRLTENLISENTLLQQQNEELRTNSSLKDVEIEELNKKIVALEKLAKPRVTEDMELKKALGGKTLSQYLADIKTTVDEANKRIAKVDEHAEILDDMQSILKDDEGNKISLKTYLSDIVDNVTILLRYVKRAFTYIKELFFSSATAERTAEISEEIREQIQNLKEADDSAEQ